MLQPKRTKHRKMQKGRMKGDTKRGAIYSIWNVWPESP